MRQKCNNDIFAERIACKSLWTVKTITHFGMVVNSSQTNLIKKFSCDNGGADNKYWEFLLRKCFKCELNFGNKSLIWCLHDEAF